MTSNTTVKQTKDRTAGAVASRAVSIRTSAMTAGLAALLLAALSSAYGAAPPQAKAQYTSMAPLHQYLDDRDAEIALARSAAPEAISRDASVLVLTEQGYVTAVEGKNGFVCAVERAWMSPEDSPNFWNPKMRGPLCFNPPAARSILPATFLRTKLAIAGKSKSEIIAANKQAYDKKELPRLEPGSMSYMMSKQAYLTASWRQPCAHHDLHAACGSGGVGRWRARLPCHPEPTVQGRRAHRCMGDWRRQMVRRNPGASDVGKQIANNSD